VERADLDRRFAPEVHGYRFGHGPQTAIVHLQRQVGRRPWIELVKADVASLFDNLDHSYLLAQVDAASPDPLWRHLARCWIAAWPHHPGHGVPQGAPLSPLFANLYLAAGVDRHLQKGDARGLIGWIRYGDDLVLAAQRPGHGPALLAWLDGLVRGCRLELGPAKTVMGCQRLGASWPATVLGYRIRFVQGRDRRWSLVILDEDHGGAMPAESWLDAPRLGAGAFARLRAPWWWRRG
jgi:retron-type reverse transcriptase